MTLMSLAARSLYTIPKYETGDIQQVVIAGSARKGVLVKGIGHVQLWSAALGDVPRHAAVCCRQWSFSQQ